MRELKFRQPIFNNEGIFIHWHYWGFIDNGCFVSPYCNPPEKAQEQSQQYTGLKDKNGKEIYEGDIVLWEDWHGFEDEMAHPEPDYDWRKPHEIIWDDCGFNIKMPFDNNLRISGKYDYIKQYGVEIIGNIYENGKLLKG